MTEKLHPSIRKYKIICKQCCDEFITALEKHNNTKINASNLEALRSTYEQGFAAGIEYMYLKAYNQGTPIEL